MAKGDRRNAPWGFHQRLSQVRIYKDVKLLTLLLWGKHVSPRSLSASGDTIRKTQRHSVEACEIRSWTTVEIKRTKYTIRGGLSILQTRILYLYSCS